MRLPTYGWASNEASQKPNPLATASIAATLSIANISRQDIAETTRRCWRSDDQLE
jgi:hypothetical protein